MQTIHAKQALTPDGWMPDQIITLDNSGRIAAITTGTGPADHRIDIALPAPVNLHSHTFQRAMSGLTEARGPGGQDSFWTWRSLMYRFLDHLTPDQIEAIATLAFSEMLEAGYGAVAEFHYVHHAPGGTAYDDRGELSARIVSAAQTAGIGLTLLPVLYTYGGCDKRALQGGQLRFRNDPDGYGALIASAQHHIAGAAADYRLGTAPHSLRAVDAAGLDAAQSLAGAGPIHIHIAEQVAEVEELMAHTGARPVEHLLAARDITDQWCLIHCTQMTDSETTALAATGAVAGLCPITEANLGDGIFNGMAFQAAGGRYGVGSDSNVHIALFEELCQLEYSQRLRHRNRAALATEARSTGRVLYDTSAAGGAQAARRDSGALMPGMWADILGISAQNPWLAGRDGDATLDSLIFSGRGRDCVSELWSAGRHVVQNGRHIGRDAAQARFMTVLNDLREAL